jgi:hypothetical protein
VDAGLGALTGQWQIVAKEAYAKDKVAIRLYSSAALPAAKGSIAAVNFIVRADCPAGAISALRLNRADFNEKPAVKKERRKTHGSKKINQPAFCFP